MQDRNYKKPAKTSVEGNLQPQAIDLEEAVLGALMLERDAIDDVIDILTPETFYLDQNKKIYSAILTLYNEAAPIDLLTVTQQLIKDGCLDDIGGAFYITQLTDRVVSAVSIEYHARILAEKFIARELIRTSSEIIQACYSQTEDIMDTLTKSETDRDNLLNNIITKKEVKNIDLFDHTLTDIENTQASPSGITGIPSGLLDLDKITGGWQKSDLIILAARPAMGKSALALQFMANAAIKNNIPAAFFSLEMSDIQLMRRLISSENEIELYKINKNKLSKDEVEKIKRNRDRVGNAPLIWDDTPGLSITEFRAKARKMKREHGIQLIGVDYLQLMDSGLSRGTRDQEIGKISRGLKLVAKELDLPIIALSQLSRAVESRPGNSKRPMLSDLRESGSIEQDADMVLFLYRAEYYKITEDEQGRSTAGVAEVIIAKNRNGETDDVEIRFVNKYTKFCDMSNYSDYENVDNQFTSNSFPDKYPSNSLTGYRDFTEPSSSNFDEDAPF